MATTIHTDTLSDIVLRHLRRPGRRIAEYERAEEHIGRAFSRMHITWF
jgi:hypothetical protein